MPRYVEESSKKCSVSGEVGQKNRKQKSPANQCKAFEVLSNQAIIKVNCIYHWQNFSQNLKSIEKANRIIPYAKPKTDQKFRAVETLHRSAARNLLGTGRKK
jgi:hypothetical protein